MRILMCASEVAPLAKTGGLADVVGALSPELKRLGHDVRIVMPFHGSINRGKLDLHLVVPQLGVPVGFGEKWCSVYETRLPGTDVPLYLVEHNQYFERLSIYQWDGVDYADNAERFAFFSRACCQIAKALSFSPDVMHCHDWQTALVPLYLKTFDAAEPNLKNTASVLTIHNVGYQGTFGPDQIVHCQLGMDWSAARDLFHYGKVNYLKAGILWSDKVSTVSRRYAYEMQTPEGGWSLDGVLRSRSPDLVGIVNGCDYREWDPNTDHFLPAHFDIGQMEGKAICKAEMQKTFNLPASPNVPVVGIVTRLAYQKGVDVLAGAMPAIMALDLQFVLLGNGETWAHFFYGDLPNVYPGKAGVMIGFDNKLAHLVYAGSDAFLMPSRYEPCGLAQLSSMRYGTPPIVRATGGLDDTVVNYNEADGSGTGFKFHDLTAAAISNTVGWFVSTYYDRPHHFQKMQEAGMKERFRWSDSAEHYQDLYRWAMEKKGAR